MINIEAKQLMIKMEVYKFYGRENWFRFKYWLEKFKIMIVEIILTSVDKEGLQNGMDFEMLESIINKINRPLIFSGGLQNCLKLRN